MRIYLNCHPQNIRVMLFKAHVPQSFYLSIIKLEFGYLADTLSLAGTHTHEKSEGCILALVVHAAY